MGELTDQGYSLGLATVPISHPALKVNPLGAFYASCADVYNHLSGSHQPTRKYFLIKSIHFNEMHSKIIFKP